MFVIRHLILKFNSMKKVFVLVVFLVGLSSFSFAQSAGKGDAERSGKRGGGMFHKERKPRKQMQHFETRGKDPNIRNNGTAYRRNHKREYYTVDGDGFGAPSVGGK
jgi:hypothetical protein